MEEDLIEEFINIGSDSYEDAEALFRLTTKYLKNIKDDSYDIESMTFVEGLLDKMATIADNFELDDQLITALEKTAQAFTQVASTPNQKHEPIVQHFNKIYAVSMKFHNSMVKIRPKKDSNLGPFQPSKADKVTITSKITEAIQLINDSEILTDKVKKKLTDRLNKVLSELHKSNSNWNTYFQQVGYCIVFLGTISTIASGATDITQLIESRNKLEEANTSIEKSSVNISREDIKEVFIIDDTVKIDTTKTLQLKEKN